MSIATKHELMVLVTLLLLALAQGCSESDSGNSGGVDDPSPDTVSVDKQGASENADAESDGDVSPLSDSIEEDTAEVDDSENGEVDDSSNGDIEELAPDTSVEEDTSSGLDVASPEDTLTEDAEDTSDEEEDVKEESAVLPQSGDLRIEEVLIAGASDGPYDPNEDGESHGLHDEFIEIRNLTDKTLDLQGVQIKEGRLSWVPRHVFGSGHALPPGEVWVVFGGGYPRSRDPGVSRSVCHHEGYGLDLGLHLTDGGNRIELAASNGEVLDSLTYGDFGGVAPPETGSLVRTEMGGWISHLEASGGALPFSPGRTIDGAWYTEP